VIPTREEMMNEIKELKEIVLNLNKKNKEE
jgi:hypothetical protein